MTQPAILVSVAFFLVTPIVNATDIVVGGTRLAIPTPPGFVVLTPQIGSAYEFQRQFVPPSNEQFLALIPESEIPIALADGIPKLHRIIRVQTAKQLLRESLSKQQFSEFKRGVKSQGDEIMERLRVTPGLTQPPDKEGFSELNLDLALSVSQVVPLAVHEDSDRTIARTMFMKYNVAGQAGSARSYVVVATSVLLHIKTKILFLYCFGGEDDLHWTRTTCTHWTESVIAANGNDVPSATEQTPNPWRRIVVQVIAGGMLGLVGWAVVFLAKRSRSR